MFTVKISWHNIVDNLDPTLSTHRLKIRIQIWLSYENNDIVSIKSIVGLL